MNVCVYTFSPLASCNDCKVTFYHRFLSKVGTSYGEKNMKKIMRLGSALEKHENRLEITLKTIFLYWSHEACCKVAYPRF